MPTAGQRDTTEHVAHVTWTGPRVWQQERTLALRMRGQASRQREDQPAPQRSTLLYEADEHHHVRGSGERLSAVKDSWRGIVRKCSILCLRVASARPLV